MGDGNGKVIASLMLVPLVSDWPLALQACPTSLGGLAPVQVKVLASLMLVSLVSDWPLALQAGPAPLGELAPVQVGGPASLIPVPWCESGLLRCKRDQRPVWVFAFIPTWLRCCVAVYLPVSSWQFGEICEFDGRAAS